MVLMTSLSTSALSVLRLCSFALTAPLSSPATQHSLLNTEISTTIITVIVQETVAPASSSVSSAASFDPAAWGPISELLGESSIATVTEIVTETEVITPSSSFAEVTSTVTAVVTETAFLSSKISTSTISTVVTVTVAPSATQTTAWSAPTQMTNLSSFNVTNFAGGSKNLRVVNGIPSKASATSAPAPTASYILVEAEVTAAPTPSVSLSGINLASPSPSSPLAPAAQPWDNSSSVLQLFYPENSINPAQKPQGGAEFYATPLPLGYANNVTFEYSVFFPKDFDWVLAGKLPGMYGGHSGCSGGDDADDCWSTRLMWRQRGAGELYLYAPKDKQTKALCDDHQSVCDAAYGFSVGRGSFFFTPGAWTNVRQTVTLNTPGKQDGCFTLDANGQRVIDRRDVYYRGLPRPPPVQAHPGSNSNKDDGETKASSRLKPIPSPPSPTHKVTPKPTPSPSTDGGLLGGLLGGIRRRYSVSVPAPDQDQAPDQDVVLSGPVDGEQESFGVATAQDSGSDEEDDTPLNDPWLDNVLQGHGTTSSDQPVGFSGIFFSTFFGGHEARYASPKDQFVWFKDFALSNNG